MLPLFLYHQRRPLRCRLSLLLLPFRVLWYLLHVPLLRPMLGRRVPLSHFEDHFEQPLLNLVLAVEVRKRPESHPRSLQGSPHLNEEAEPSVPSHFPTTDTEIASQIL